MIILYRSHLLQEPEKSVEKTKFLRDSDIFQFFPLRELSHQKTRPDTFHWILVV